MAKKAIIVAGMHRSGTSLLTAVLGHLGCDLPKDLMQADAHNRFGYWESNEIRRLNDEILESAGSSWDDCTPFNRDWRTSPRADVLLPELRRVIKAEYGSSPLYVVKDPRICRMLPIWLDAFRDVGSEPHVILQVRDPVEVAQSLRSRDGMDTSVGVILWLRHVLEAERSTRGFKRVVVQLDDVLGDWTGVVAAVGQQFGIKWPSNSPDSHMRIENEIRQDALHHRASKGGALGNEGLSQWAKSAYEVAVEAANGDFSDPARRELDRIHGLLDESMDLFGRALAVERALREQLAGATQRADELDRVRLDHETQIEQARTTEAALHERLEDIGEKLASSDRRVDSLMHTVASRDGTIGDLHEKLTDAGAEVARHTKSMQELSAAFDASTVSANELRASLNEKQTAVSHLEQELADINLELANRDSQIGALERGLEDAQEHVVEQDRANTELEDRLSERESTLANRIEQIRTLEQAFSASERSLEEIRATLDERNKAVTDLKANVRLLEERLSDRGNRLSELAREVSDKETSLENARVALDQRDRALADLKANNQLLGDKLSKRESRLSLLANEVKDGQAALEKTRATLEDHETTILALRTGHAALENRLADRGNRLSELASQVSMSGASLEKANASIAELQAGLKGAKAQHEADKLAIEEAAARHLAESRELQGRLREADEQAASANGEVRRLKSEAEDLDTRVAALLASTSWRITLPIRAARTGLSSLSGVVRRLAYSAVSVVGRTVWRALPLTESSRDTLRDRFGWMREKIDEGKRTQSYFVAVERTELAEICSKRSTDPNSAVPVLFDEEYYLRDNDDIRMAGIDAFEHYLNHGAIEGRWPFETKPESLDRDIVALHRLDLANDQVFSFDQQFYAKLYPDLAGMQANELEEHYEKRGRRENRYGSKGEFVRSFSDNPCEIPIDFNANEYTSLYPDLDVYTEKPLAALEHYMRHGRWEPRLYTLKWRSFRALEEPRQSTTNGDVEAGERLCVLAHVFYYDLWPELAEYMSNIDWNVGDLYINLVDTTFEPSIIDDIRLQFPFARIYISENKGRDIGGHVNLLRHIAISDYGFFLLLHTKKSPHMPLGEAQLWRNNLLLPIIGTRDVVKGNLERLRSDELVGAVGSKACRYTQMDENEAKVMELIDRLGADRDTGDMEFVTGTMLFLRAVVVERLFDLIGDLDYRTTDDSSSDFLRDGQWEHAVERIIGVLVRHMRLRFEWV